MAKKRSSSHARGRSGLPPAGDIPSVFLVQPLLADHEVLARSPERGDCSQVRTFKPQRGEQP